MSEVNGQNYNIKQLREWLRNLDLCTTGNKATLVSRLNTVPPEDRGTCPHVLDDEENKNNNEEQDDESVYNEVDSVCAESREIQLLKREMALMAKEKELLQREIDFLKQTTDFGTASAISMPQKNDFTFTTIKDLIPEYDGSGSVELWLTQLCNVGKMCFVKEEILKALLLCKLKGNAQSWLHSKTDYASATVDTLIEDMREAFKLQGGKLQQRRKFESRTWVTDESFVKYYNDKMMLANDLHMEETELIEHLIEGISNIQLRNQAAIQCFDSTEKLLRAFSKIELPKFNKPATINKTEMGRSNEGNIRCFNCNSVGHYAVNCQKPKREMGACYGCGSMEHKITACPNRKVIHVVQETDYVRCFNFYTNNITYFSLLCLIDSGSPISMVKERCIPKTVEILNCNYFYFGLNKSPLKTIGKIVCYVFPNKVEKIELIVVDNESMGYDAVVGRNFMEKIGIKLIQDNNQKNNINEIKIMRQNNEIDKSYESDRNCKINENKKYKFVNTKEDQNEIESLNVKNTDIKVKEQHYLKKNDTKQLCEYTNSLIDKNVIENDNVKIFNETLAIEYDLNEDCKNCKEGEHMVPIETFKLNNIVKTYSNIVPCCDVNTNSTKNIIISSTNLGQNSITESTKFHCKNTQTDPNIKLASNDNEKFEDLNRCIVFKSDKEKTVQNSYRLSEFENSLFAIDCSDNRPSILKETVVVSNSIPFDIKEKLITLIEKNYLCPKRPHEPKVKFEMKLTLNNTNPFHCTPRRISYTEKNELQKLLDEYLEKRYIQTSESEFASPIVLVKKKTGDIRLCIDYRTLNKVTVKDNYPIPVIDDLLDKLTKKKLFSKLDLKNGFFHVYMHRDSVKYTSFVTPLGQFDFLRMPFGLKNAPSVFQRFINKIFADMIRENKIIVYLDDIMIATVDVDEHMKILCEVFSRLVENKLELRLDKCEFLRTDIKFLGYKITGEGIRADEKGLQAVQDFPIPNKLQMVQSFLGLCSYFRRFIKNFSLIATPLYDLTKKNVPFNFGEAELKCFDLLKRKLLESPTLGLYDPKSETELHCDASILGFGAILLQKQDDGKFHPIFYFSKRSTEAEAKYHSFELETLAIIYALKRFRIYLLGIPFKIVTDCNSLTLTLNKKEINPRIARWALDLQNYDYTLEHRKSHRMQHVDALSRCTNILVIESNTFEETLVICQNRDNKLKQLKEELQKTESNLYEMRNGVIYRKKDRDKLLFYVPEEMEKQVMYKFHDEFGHVGIDKTVDSIMKSYWFPKLKEKVTQHIRNCLKCIVFSSKQGKEEGFLHIIPKGNKPFEVLHIDHYGPIDPNVKIKKHILVIIDAFSKFVRLYCTKTTNSKEVISSLSDYFRAYSRPTCIISDRGSSFTSVDFKNFLEEKGVKHIKNATASPQANGQVERVNRSIGPMIAKLVDSDKGIHWNSVVEIVEFTLNNTLHRAIGCCPSLALFGICQKGKISDILQEELSNLNKVKEQSLEEIRNSIVVKQKNLQDYNKKYFDKKRKKPNTYNIGDYVMIKNFDSHTTVAKKLIPKFKGPYQIEKILRNDRYLLKDVEGFQQTQIPYAGVWAVSNIRPWMSKN